MGKERLLSGLLVCVVNDDYMKRVLFVNQAFGYSDGNEFHNLVDEEDYPIMDVTRGIKEYDEGYYVGYLKSLNDVCEVDFDVCNMDLPDSERYPVRLRGDKK